MKARPSLCVAIVIGAASMALLAGSQFGPALAQGIAPKAQVALTGTWEALDQPGEPWLFSLQENGNRVTGRVWQENGLTGPAEIIEGRVDGARITVKYRSLSLISSQAAQLRPNPPRGQLDPTATFTITLTGALRSNEIAFTSKVDDPKGAAGGLPLARALLGNSAARPMGVFGKGIPQKFTVRRSSFMPVAGKVIVESEKSARPTFQLRFTDANGRRYEPVTRDVWPSSAPKSTFDAAPFAFVGSPFDAAPRFSTRTLPGNPRDFVVRLPAGTYRLAVTGLPAGYVLNSIRAGSVDLNTANLEIAADSVPPDVTVVLGVTSDASWSRVSGRVVNAATRVAERGQIGGLVPSAPTAVVLVSPVFSEYWVAPIGSNGQFEFGRVWPGQYEVHFFPDSENTPVLKLAVPPTDALNVDMRAPDVPVLPCPNC